MWKGTGPLSLIASVDCAELPTEALDIDLPDAGTLLFFYFGGQFDDGESMVFLDEPETREGARVLFVPAGRNTSEREAPDGLKPYPMAPLTAKLWMTAASPEHPQIRDTFAPDTWPEEFYEHPVSADEFLGDLHDSEEFGHQIGGHAKPQQALVELEVAHTALGGEMSGDDPRLREDLSNWLLLAQFQSEDDVDMDWAGGGTLYWLIRPEDLAERRFDRAWFTWQC